MLLHGTTTAAPLVELSGYKLRELQAALAFDVQFFLLALYNHLFVQSPLPSSLVPCGTTFKSLPRSTAAETLLEPLLSFTRAVFGTSVVPFLTKLQLCWYFIRLRPNGRPAV